MMRTLDNPVRHPLARRRFVGGIAGCAGLVTAGGLFAQQDEYGDASLRGAGSTFVQPLMEAWVHAYRTDPYQVLGGVSRRPESGLSDNLSSDELDYEPIGSLAGIQRIRAGFVDFAASEMPLGADYLKRAGLLQFPWVAGAVGVVVTGLSQGGGSLKLDAATLGAIYLGRITRWSDPAIVALNPGYPLPDSSITVVHRSDGSGTTFTFARYLAGSVAEWKERVGADLLLKWPAGRGEKGNEGVVRALGATPMAIGYVNAVQARRVGLSLVALKNAAGNFVLPDAAGVGAAMRAERSGADVMQQLPIDAPGPDSYPIVATVFGLVRDRITSRRQRRAADFLAWTLTQGAKIADRLGYSSLPEVMTRPTIERLTAAG